MDSPGETPRPAPAEGPAPPPAAPEGPASFGSRLGTFLRRERTLHVLLLALGGWLLIGALRPRLITGMSPDSFWKSKMALHACADLVLGGDSRTYVGVSPAALGAIPGRRRMINFGFDNAGFSGEYLGGLEDVLDPASPAPTIVLGITPHSLTPQTGGRFIARRRGLTGRRAALSGHGLRSSSWFANASETVPLHQAALFLTGSPRLPRLQRRYQADGWLASRLTPEMPETGFAIARGWYVGNRVDPTMVDGLLRKVGEWKARGITVVGFRPPTDPGLARLEDELSGFSQEDFVCRFAAAGGRWLAIDPAPYHTYDSSHLDRDSAVAFSRDLGILLGGTDGR